MTKKVNEIHPITQELFTNFGTLLKQLHCPLAKKWDQLEPTSDAQAKTCSTCNKAVYDTSKLSDSEVCILLNEAPKSCLKVDLEQSSLTITYASRDKGTEHPELRVIKTARNEQVINEAVERGFWLLVNLVVPSPEIKTKFAISQHKSTGKIGVSNDYRDTTMLGPIEPIGELSHQMQEEIGSFISSFPNVKDLKPRVIEDEIVIGWTYYYPYHFESPFAAYLIPNELKVGETVFQEDLIEDVVGSRWNQGDKYRLPSCKAVWNGKEFILEYDPHVRQWLLAKLHMLQVFEKVARFWYYCFTLRNADLWIR